MYIDGALIRAFVWLVLILIIGLGSTFTVANEIIRSNLRPVEPVLIRDTIGAGTHTLTGVVYVHSPCDEITVTTKQLDETSYALLINTWREPHIPSCEMTKVTRRFNAIVFAPSLGTKFSLLIDGTPFPVAVIQDIPLKRPLGTGTSTTSKTQ